jgi:mono/diheme cytochrome c family protein
MRVEVIRAMWWLVMVTTVASTRTAAQRPIVPAGATSMLSGREIFQFYCASCHGPRGTGDGPVATSLRTQPPDLTTIASRKGYFPADDLRRFVAGAEPMPSAHGSREMPVWGPFFRHLQPRDGLADIRVENVVSFVESLQKP